MSNPKTPSESVTDLPSLNLGPETTNGYEAFTFIMKQVKTNGYDVRVGRYTESQRFNITEIYINPKNKTLEDSFKAIIEYFEKQGCQVEVNLDEKNKKRGYLKVTLPERDDHKLTIELMKGYFQKKVSDTVEKK